MQSKLANCLVYSNKLTVVEAYSHSLSTAEKR